MRGAGPGAVAAQSGQGRKARPGRSGQPGIPRFMSVPLRPSEAPIHRQEGRGVSVDDLGGEVFLRSQETNNARRGRRTGERHLK